MKNNRDFYPFKKKVLALAPLDGYSDCAFREISKKYGSPDLIFTEFVSSHGLVENISKLVNVFRYSEFQRPIIAQLSGNNPRYIHEASLIVLELGFDGIDINMGCPSKNVSSNGSGADLIRNPKKAVSIINTVNKAREEYKKGDKILNIREKEEILNRVNKWKVMVKKDRKITISVKTRIGYDKDNVERWIGHLIETNIDFISIHARTHKQKYKGKANWDAIKKAVEKSNVPIIGNGDVKNRKDIDRMFNETGCKGVMIGRAAIGNPWIFDRGFSKGENFNKVKEVALEHAELFSKLKGDGRFYEMRKHLLSYFKNFKGAKNLRSKVARMKNIEELKKLLNDY